MTARLIVIATATLAWAAPASARTVTGLVYEDVNRDGHPSAGEPGVAGVVVAYDITQFTVSDAHGQFQLDVPPASRGVAWARVPDGFVPGPVWATVGKAEHVDLGLRRLAEPMRGPLTFVVAADTHITGAQPFADDLAAAVVDATALDPRPAFFTILGDITQSDQNAEFDRVDHALAGLDVPYIPVPGNHDWYDGGKAWFRRYGPDNYSFDLDRTHFVVWNMSMVEEDIARYLGAELARVAPDMTIVALTHAPPTPAVVEVLRRLGVDYVLTGHTHSNRVVDHGELIELSTEPLLMGGLDFTPAGYRIVTLDRGKLASEHRTVVDEPLLAIVAPAAGQCVATREVPLIVAAALDAGHAHVTATLDCATHLELRAAGGWSWSAMLPALTPGAHTIIVDAQSSSGAHVTRAAAFEVCAALPVAHLRAGAAWTQLGGSADHRGAIEHELPPPLVTRWTASVGGHVLHAAPAIAGGLVYVTVADLADGTAGGVVALDLVTGGVRWRTHTALPVRGGVAVVGDTVVAAQLDGIVIALDAATGTERWRYELGAGIPPRGAATFAPAITDEGDIVIGNQRALAAVFRGTAMWRAEPVPIAEEFPGVGTAASSGGVLVGMFTRAAGGIAAWDRETGELLWRDDSDRATGVNASPVIDGDTVFLVNGMTDVFALELATGALRWKTRLDPTGFDWGTATIGTPALAHGILVVPTLYRDLVGVDAASGRVLWRFAAHAGPLRTTHYRGRGEQGFAASPVITGDIVWAAETSGELTALDLTTGAPLWHTELGTPVLAGLAVSGDSLIAASYDGTVRALTPTPRERIVLTPRTCEAPAHTGCCDARTRDGSPLLGVVIVLWLRRRRRATA